MVYSVKSFGILDKLQNMSLFMLITTPYNVRCQPHERHFTDKKKGEKRVFDKFFLPRAIDRT